jgi:biotin carboxylase
MNNVANVRILIFGGDYGQLTMVNLCKNRGYYTVVIDPNPHAIAKDYCDYFEVVDGQDFKGTCDVIERHNITYIITVATDKPLVMMARVAEKYGLNFISENTARDCTDKVRMKETFKKNGIPCADYKLITEITDDLRYPLVIKPRDNSGSRGVAICNTKEEAECAIVDARKFTRLENIMCEEVIEGKEYSLESLHYDGQTKLLQITDKKMTDMPYRCEMELTHPSLFNDEEYKRIESLVHDISIAFNFSNCPSHCEILVNGSEIKVLEASARMGGDYICSHLVPLSTGISMESAALDITIGQQPDFSNYHLKASGIYYFEFGQGIVKHIAPYDHLKSLPGVVEFKLSLQVESVVPKIKFGPDRYGYVILQKNNRQELFELKNYIFEAMNSIVTIE